MIDQLTSLLGVVSLHPRHSPRLLSPILPLHPLRRLSPQSSSSSSPRPRRRCPPLSHPSPSPHRPMSGCPLLSRSNPRRSPPPSPIPPPRCRRHSSEDFPRALTRPTQHPSGGEQARHNCPVSLTSALRTMRPRQCSRCPWLSSLRPPAVPASIAAPAVANVAHQLQTEPERCPTGFKNAGNNLCYANSALQFLAHCPSIGQFLSSTSLPTDPSAECSILQSLGRLMQEYWSGQVNVIDTLSFRNLVGRHCNDYNNGAMQDCHDFLLCLLNLITSNKGNADKIKDTLYGTKCNRFVCMECDATTDSTTYNRDPALELNIIKKPRPQKATLQDCLDKLHSSEMMDSIYNCPNCKEQSPASIQIVHCELPSVFIIRLRRFQRQQRKTRSDEYTVKIHAPVVFAEEVDMGKFLKTPPQASARTTYTLFGVINHEGTASIGHYTAYLKHRDTGNWYHFNDSTVSPTQVDRALESTTKSYILFYHKTTRRRLYIDLITLRSPQALWALQHYTSAWARARREM